MSRFLKAALMVLFGLASTACALTAGTDASFMPRSTPELAVDAHATPLSNCNSETDSLLNLALAAGPGAADALRKTCRSLASSVLLLAAVLSMEELAPYDVFRQNPEGKRRPEPIERFFVERLGPAARLAWNLYMQTAPDSASKRMLKCSNYSVGPLDFGPEKRIDLDGEEVTREGLRIKMVQSVAAKKQTCDSTEIITEAVLRERWEKLKIVGTVPQGEYTHCDLRNSPLRNSPNNFQFLFESKNVQVCRSLAAAFLEWCEGHQLDVYPAWLRGKRNMLADAATRKVDIIFRIFPETVMHYLSDRSLVDEWWVRAESHHRSMMSIEL